MDKRIFLTASLFAVFLVVGGVPRWFAHEKLTAGEGKLTLEVTVATPRRVSAGNLTVPANLDAYDEAAVSARASGVVIRRHADIGTRVRRGQVLAEIDAPDLDHQTDQAVADVSRAAAADEQAQAAIGDAQAQVLRANAKVKQSQANIAVAVANLRRAERAVATQRSQTVSAKSRLDLTKVTYQRWAALLKDGAVPPQDVDDRRSAFEQAQAQHHAARTATQEAQAQLEAMRAQLEASKADLNASLADENSALQHVQAAVAGQNASIASHRSSQANARRYQAMQGFEKVLAPFNGVVTIRNIDVGSQVAPGMPANGMFRVGRSDRLRTKIQIPERFSGSITDNMPARVKVPQFPERHFDGKVVRRSGALDGDTRTLQVEVTVENPTGILIPGMYGQVQFEMAGKPTLRVPASCVMMTSKGPRVGVVDEQNLVHFVSVELGDDLGTEIEVFKGLEPTARMLTNPNYSIVDGTLVKPTLLTPSPTPRAEPSR